MRIATGLFVGCVYLTVTILEIFAFLSYFRTVRLGRVDGEAGHSDRRKNIALCSIVRL
jgi:hypothetical protein